MPINAQEKTIIERLEYLKSKCIGGYNLSCIGDEKMHSYMPSKNMNSISTRCLEQAYKDLKINAKKFSFLERSEFICFKKRVIAIIIISNAMNNLR